MIISKETFVNVIERIKDSISEPYVKKSAKNEAGELQVEKDFINMLVLAAKDTEGVIREYIYQRDNNGELFFCKRTVRGLKPVVIDSAESLYDYLEEKYPRVKIAR